MRFFGFRVRRTAMTARHFSDELERQSGRRSWHRQPGGAEPFTRILYIFASLVIAAGISLSFTLSLLYETSANAAALTPASQTYKILIYRKKSSDDVELYQRLKDWLQERSFDLELSRVPELQSESNRLDPDRPYWFVRVPAIMVPDLVAWISSSGYTPGGSLFMPQDPRYSDPVVQAHFVRGNAILRSAAVEMLNASLRRESLPQISAQLRVNMRMFQEEFLNFDSTGNEYLNEAIPLDGGWVDLFQEQSTIEHIGHNLSLLDEDYVRKIFAESQEKIENAIDPAEFKMNGTSIFLPDEILREISNLALIDQMESMPDEKSPMREFVWQMHIRRHHRLTSSPEMLAFEGRLAAIEQIISMWTPRNFNDGFNAETLELLNYGLLESLTLLDSMAHPRETAEVLNRLLSSNQWFLNSLRIGKWGRHAYGKILEYSELSPYVQLLLRAKMSQATELSPTPKDLQNYQNLPRLFGIESSPKSIVYGRILVHVGALSNSSPMDFESPRPGIRLIERWLSRHGVALHDWSAVVTQPFDVTRTRLWEARQRIFNDLHVGESGPSLQPQSQSQIPQLPDGQRQFATLQELINSCNRNLQ